MSTFDNREKAFEDMYAHDAELRFKLTARRDKLVGLWAAGKLGKTGDAATTYAGSIVAEDVKHPGDQDVIDKLTADLGGRATAADIAAAMADALIEAERQLAAG